MLKISDFSKLSSISIRMLRFYDEKNVLKPVKIEENGYRYYDVKQLRWATQIHYFRYLEFSTIDIKVLMSRLEQGEEIQTFLNERLLALKKDTQMMIEKMETLQKTIDKFNQEEIVMNYNVEVKEFPSYFMMSKRGIIPSYDQEGMLWQDLNQELKENGIIVNNKPNAISMAVFHDEGFKDRDVDIEIRIEVDESKYEESETIKFGWSEPVKVASITYTGGYEHITGVCLQIAKWLSDNHFEIAGPNFSVYHVGYAQTQNQKEFVTEICYPFK